MLKLIKTYLILFQVLIKRKYFEFILLVYQLIICSLIFFLHNCYQRVGLIKSITQQECHPLKIPILFLGDSNDSLYYFRQAPHFVLVIIMVFFINAIYFSNIVI